VALVARGRRAGGACGRAAGFGWGWLALGAVLVLLGAAWLHGGAARTISVGGKAARAAACAPKPT
jgi:hypothetical protein